ncbi:MAG: hypothetical protein IJ094_01210 [Bacilli bacterium]|nr:hypothetical protein [Bacilli bacterium]
MSSNLILTDVAFRNYFNFRGNLAIISGGASGGGYTINEVKLISDKNDRFEYEFFGNYEWAQHIIDINGKCIVVIENGKPVIDSFKVDQNVNDKQEL